MSDRRMQLWCAYSVFGFIAVFLVGWVVLAGFVPPPSPTDSAQHIAAAYEERLVGIRVGLVLCIFASALLLPWGGAICAQMLRIEEPGLPWYGRGWPPKVALSSNSSIRAPSGCRRIPDDDPMRVQTFNDLGGSRFSASSVPASSKWLHSRF